MRILIGTIRVNVFAEVKADGRTILQGEGRTLLALEQREPRAVPRQARCARAGRMTRRRIVLEGR
jgi:hypothetical protein